jgi:hypothetical protein
MAVYTVESSRPLIVSYPQQVLLAIQVFAVFCVRESLIPSSGDIKLYATHYKFGGNLALGYTSNLLPSG